MSIVNEFRGISVGDKVICIKHSYACHARIGTVKEIRVNEGAKYGWYKGFFENSKDGF